LLDDRKGGRFALAPVTQATTTKQMYLPDAAILVTRHLGRNGVPGQAPAPEVPRDGRVTQVLEAEALQLLRERGPNRTIRVNRPCRRCARRTRTASCLLRA
jgi:hypothetical protein